MKMELHTDGSVVVEDEAKAPTLAEAQKFVGGYIEIQTITLERKPAQLVMNEEGKLMNLPVNAKATAIWQASRPTHDVIVGPALILTGKARMK